MLHMNESEYTVYTEKALKGSVKMHYLLPLMNQWRKEKKAALNSVGTGCDDLEAKDSQRLGSHDESQSQGNDVEGSNAKSDSVASIIVRISSTAHFSHT